MQKPHSTPQLEAIQILISNQWEFTWTEVSPKPSKQRASQESRSHERTVMKGWETSRENSPAKGIGWTSTPTLGIDEKTNTQREYSHPQSKQNPEPANEARMLKLSHGQNCPRHSPEESYKRRASFQFHFIHFCSARDTRPQNFN